MRAELLKLKKYNSTKSERRIGEILKRNRIKFKSKWIIGNIEVDFLIGKVALEIDGDVHKKTDTNKDIFLTSLGYVPIHIRSYENMFLLENQLLRIIQNNRNNSCQAK